VRNPSCLDRGRQRAGEEAPPRWIGANRPAEAIYIVGGADRAGTLLNGATRYVLTVPAGHLLPARYCWSLTEMTLRLYGPRADALRGTYRHPPITKVGSSAP
jgi:hypothetical protein